MDSTVYFFGVKPIVNLGVVASSGADLTFATEASHGPSSLRQPAEHCDRLYRVRLCRRDHPWRVLGSEDSRNSGLLARRYRGSSG